MSEKPQIQVNAQRVIAALTGLHRAWPLANRIRNEACDDTRETYLAALLRWSQTGTAPLTSGFDGPSLDELLALDVLSIAGESISCPPFCATPTDITIRFPHETLFALSALDALALPRLLGQSGSIEARCGISGQAIQFTVTGQGELSPDSVNIACVGFLKMADTIQRYALDLAPGIRFVQPEYRDQLGQSLSLPEALAVANAFYAFQHKLLTGDA